MAKTNNTREWLKGFEILAGRPIVLSLVIEAGEIKFVSCIAKDYHSLGEEEDEGGDDMPDLNLEKVKNHVKAHELPMTDYIG